MDGVIVADKPEGLTSHDVVNRVRRLANTRKVGHLGTLDPMATGVLPLVIGRATRLAQFFSTAEKKRYDATVKFGWATDTYDRTGTPVGEVVEPVFSCAELEAELRSFAGKQLQTPPPFSAKKVRGTPAYRLARKQLAVELEPVEIDVFGIELLSFDSGSARIRVDCSRGTYLRGIAHQLGQRLGCGAFLDSLRRTISGEFTSEHAHTLEQLQSMAQAGRLGDALIPAPHLLPEMPNATIDPLTAGQIRQGRDFRLSAFAGRSNAKYVKALSEEGELIAIGEARLPNLYHPVLVL